MASWLTTTRGLAVRWIAGPIERHAELTNGHREGVDVFVSDPTNGVGVVGLGSELGTKGSEACQEGGELIDHTVKVEVERASVALYVLSLILAARCTLLGGMQRQQTSNPLHHLVGLGAEGPHHEPAMPITLHILLFLGRNRGDYGPTSHTIGTVHIAIT